MIDLNHIQYEYPGARGTPVLDGLNLRVRSGETILIAGASGSGKSTLSFLLGGLIPHLLGRPAERKGLFG